MTLRLSEPLADAQVRHRVWAGQQLEGQQVLREVLGHLGHPRRAAFLPGRCLRAVDDRQRVGAGARRGVQRHHRGGTEAQGLTETFPQQRVHHAHLALHHTDRRVVDTRAVTGGRVVALEEVLVKPQPRLTTGVRGALDGGHVHAGHQPHDGPDLRGDVLHERRDADDRSEGRRQNIAVGRLQGVLGLLERHHAVGVPVRLAGETGDGHGVGHHLGDVARELGVRGRVVHRVVPGRLRLPHRAVVVGQAFLEALSKEAGQRGQAVRELAHSGDRPGLGQGELFQDGAQAVRVPACDAVDGQERGVH